MKNRKQRRVIFLLIMLLTVTIGFALLSTTLKINGVAGINKNTWNIHWDDTSINVKTGSVEASNPIVSKTTNNKDTVSFNVELSLPGDFYEFEIDAINEGSIDGSISLINNKTYKLVDGEIKEQELPNYILYTVKYNDNTTPQEGDILEKSQSKTYKIRVEYDSNSSTLVNEDTTYKFEYSINYTQYKQETVEPRTCEQFTNDSWSTIIKNVKIDPTVYPVGCEKEIELNNFGTHTVRIANTSTPDECLNDNYSQTACGFVLEFTDIIAKHVFNTIWQYNDVPGHGTKGGWESSEMREYVRTDIYNSFPDEIKNNIIRTYTISGGEPPMQNNILYYNQEKIYLLSPKELNYSSNNDHATNLTKVLDYYLINYRPGYTNAHLTKKLYNGEESIWALRTANNNVNGWLFYVGIKGDIYGDNYGTSNLDYGISPAFRIGKDWVLKNSKTPLKEQKWEYYINNKKKLQNGWYKLQDFSNTDQYYFFENGFMKLGWYTDSNNNTYYLSEQDSDGNGYADGNRVSGTINIDGTDYTFDENGVCTSCS